MSDTEPNLVQKAGNFGRALVRHMVDRARKLDDDEYKARLAVCRDCDSCDLERMVCREVRCGCFLKRKARWRSEVCPIGKWPEV